MKLTDAERTLRQLVLGADEALFPDVDPVRQRLYRRLVRNNLFGAVERAIPITRKILGDDAVDALVARFLDEVGPQTRLVRQVASELAAWLMQQPDLPHPACGELAHWEALEIDVGLAPEWEGPALPKKPADDARVETHPSARLSAYRHAVHAMTTADTAYPAPSPEPVLLLTWRAGERFCWKVLEGGLAKVLVETAQGATLGQAFANVEAALIDGDVLDRARVRSQLVDLCGRGAIVGFPRA